MVDFPLGRFTIFSAVKTFLGGEKWRGEGALSPLAGHVSSVFQGVTLDKCNVKLVIRTFVLHSLKEIKLCLLEMSYTSS